MASDEKPIPDWVNFPESVPTVSLWDALHDGDVLSIESDQLARTVTLRFDVFYVRSARALHSVPWPGGCQIPPGAANDQQSIIIAEYHRKWREESLSWTDFERLNKDDFQVGNATLGRSPDVVTLQLGFLAGDDYITAYVRGEGATFHIGENEVTIEEFLALGEAYWNAFAKRASERKADSM